MTVSPTLTKRDPIRSGPPTVRAPPRHHHRPCDVRGLARLSRFSFTRPAPFPICPCHRRSTSARRLTRKSLLAAPAAAVASGLRPPRGALALLGAPPSPTIAQRWLGSLELGGTTVELAHPADLVGLEGREPARADPPALSRRRRPLEQLGFRGTERTRTGSPTTERAAARRADMDPRDHGSGDLPHAHARRHATAPRQCQRWRGSHGARKHRPAARHGREPAAGHAEPVGGGGPATDHGPPSVGPGTVATNDARIRSSANGLRPPHGQPQRLRGERSARHGRTQAVACCASPRS